MDKNEKFKDLIEELKLLAKDKNIILPPISDCELEELMYNDLELYKDKPIFQFESNNRIILAKRIPNNIYELSLV